MNMFGTFSVHGQYFISEFWKTSYFHSANPQQLLYLNHSNQDNRIQMGFGAFIRELSVNSLEHSAEGLMSVVLSGEGNPILRYQTWVSNGIKQQWQ